MDILIDREFFYISQKKLQDSEISEILSSAFINQLTQRKIL